MRLKTAVLFSLMLAPLAWAGAQVRVHTGDLLFVGLPSDYPPTDDTTLSGAISAATGHKGEIHYIHVAILEVDENEQVWVVDATLKHGVDRHPFDTFLVDFTLKDGTYPYLMVMRLKNKKNARKAREFVENAKKMCGEGYDLYFLPDNGLHYCSELVYDAYITPRGRHLFHAAPMNFKSEDGTYPPYWVQLFQRLNRPVPQGVLGTNPNAMSREKRLGKVGALAVRNRP